MIKVPNLTFRIIYTLKSYVTLRMVKVTDKRSFKKTGSSISKRIAWLRLQLASIELKPRIHPRLLVSRLIRDDKRILAEMSDAEIDRTYRTDLKRTGLGTTSDYRPLI